MSEPIADLSYRDYSGEHASSSRRWLVIAKMGWRTAFKKRSFWVFSAFAAWYYFVMVAFLYVIEQVGIARNVDDIQQAILGNLVWKDQFLTGFTYSQLVWLSLGLLVGAGAIANDNGTNALLVYLSKPCRKSDYLFGKWAGVFLPLLVGMAVPTVFFYIYGLLNYREYGFVSQDPWLGVRLAVMLIGAAVFQTSVVVGVSSLFNQGRMAGAAYAAAYFLLTFFSFLMLIAWAVSEGPSRMSRDVTGQESLAERRRFGQTAGRLHYLSFDGLQVGWAKVVLDTHGSGPFGVDSREMRQIKAPPATLVIVPMAALSLLGVSLAWRRVRAVEVVK